MAVSLTDLRADCGEVYDSLTNGTTAAQSLLTKAGNRISLISGTTTGFDLAIRSLAGYFICQQVLGSSSSTNQTIGAITVGRKEIVAMREAFKEDAMAVMAAKGYAFSPGNLPFEVVNQ